MNQNTETKLERIIERDVEKYAIPVWGYTCVAGIVVLFGYLIYKIIT